MRNDLEALAKLEVGVTPTPGQMIVQAKDTTKKRWRVRLKTAQAAAMLMQDTQDDLENLEEFQQSAFVSVGLKVGAPHSKRTGHARNARSVSPTSKQCVCMKLLFTN